MVLSGERKFVIFSVLLSFLSLILVLFSWNSEMSIQLSYFTINNQTPFNTSLSMYLSSHSSSYYFTPPMYLFLLVLLLDCVLQLFNSKYLFFKNHSLRAKIFLLLFLYIFLKASMFLVLFNIFVGASFYFIFLQSTPVYFKMFVNPSFTWFSILGTILVLFIINMFLVTTFRKFNQKNESSMSRIDAGIAADKKQPFYTKYNVLYTYIYEIILLFLSINIILLIPTIFTFSSLFYSFDLNTILPELYLLVFLLLYIGFIFRYSFPKLSFYLYDNMPKKTVVFKILNKSVNVHLEKTQNQSILKYSILFLQPVIIFVLLLLFIMFPDENLGYSYSLLYVINSIIVIIILSIGLVLGLLFFAKINTKFIKISKIGIQFGLIMGILVFSLVFINFNILTINDVNSHIFYENFTVSSLNNRTVHGTINSSIEFDLYQSDPNSSLLLHTISFNAFAIFNMSNNSTTTIIVENYYNITTVLFNSQFINKSGNYYLIHLNPMLENNLSFEINQSLTYDAHLHYGLGKITTTFINGKDEIVCGLITLPMDVIKIISHNTS